MCIGTMGFEIAGSFKPGTSEWDFRTFGTGQGFVADVIIAGILKSRNSTTLFNLDTGELLCQKGRLGNERTYLDATNGRIVSTGNYNGEVNRLTIQNGLINNKGPFRIENDIDGADRQSSILMSWNPYNKRAGISIFSTSILIHSTYNIAIMADKIELDGEVTVTGSLAVSGNKNCIQKTENFGERLFYSVEDTDSYLTYTEPKMQTTENNTLKVEIDSIYKECVNLDISYIVEIHKHSFGDFKIAEQTKDYFIVESDKENFEFKYTIKAKRRGFEDKHIDEYIRKEDVDGTNEYNLK